MPSRSQRTSAAKRADRAVLHPFELRIAFFLLRIPQRRELVAQADSVSIADSEFFPFC